MCAVELSEAGDGTVEIILTGPNGQLIPHQIVTTDDSSRLQVHYTPMMSGNHCAAVTYNGVPVSGSFQMDKRLVLYIELIVKHF